MNAAVLCTGLMLLTPGCEAVGDLVEQSHEPPTSPSVLVRAKRGASASLTITTCAPTVHRAQLLAEVLMQLASQGELVVAAKGGSARLVLNLCGFVPGAALDLNATPVVRTGR